MLISNAYAQAAGAASTQDSLMQLLPLILMLSGMEYGVQIGGLLALIGTYVTEKIWVEAPQRIALS